MLKRIILSIALIAPAVTQAAVYQCKVNGQTVFSDQPCGDDAKKIEVRAPKSQGSLMVSDGAQDFMQQREVDRRLNGIAREIRELEKQKEASRRNMNAAMRRFESDRNRANNNLAGAVWEGSLAEGAELQRQRYQSEIDMADRQIDRLIQERERIREAN
jgi:arylsulfatase A-like enzyme